MSDQVGSRDSRWLHLAILAGILVVAVAVRVYQFRGFGAVDDAAYAEIANRIATGEPVIGAYDGPPAFPLRAGITVPTAVMFGLFGVAEWTQAAFNFFLSLMGVVLAYACGRHFFDARAGLVAAAIAALIPIDTFHASILAPDPPSAITLGAAILMTVVTVSDRDASRGRLLAGGIAAGLLLALSWLTKEAVAFAAPFFLFLILKEWRRLGQLWVVWAGIAVSSLGILFAEAWFYQSATGDWLYHFSETERNYAENPRAFAVGGLNPGDDGYGRAVLRRLVYTGPWTMLMNPRLGYVPLFGGLLGVWGLWRRDWRYVVPVAWLLSLGLMFNFASSSTRAYVPLLLFDRYLYPLLLPATVLIAGFLVRPWEEGDAGAARPRPGRLLASGAVGLFLLVTFVDQNRAYRAFSPGWTAEAKEIATILDPDDRVYADAYSIHGLDFFWQYPEEPNLVNLEGMTDASAVRPGEYVLINQRYLDGLAGLSGWWPSENDPYARPPFADSPPASWAPIWTNEHATLYEAR